MFLILSTGLISCKKKKAATVPTNPITTDVAGTYEGNLPCADCEAIFTSLKLNMDSSALVTSTNVGKDGAATSAYGTWTLNNRKVDVTLGDVMTIYQYNDSGNLETVSNGKTYELKRISDNEE